MSRILVVEDNSDARQMCARILRDQGYEVVTANNGWEALLALDEQSVDLIVLDILMPGMDGGTFMRILRQDSGKKPPIPVLVLTALDQEEAFTRLREENVAGVITKKNNALDQMLAAIERVLQVKGGELQ